jgi:hypothetical protein
MSNSNRIEYSADVDVLNGDLKIQIPFAQGLIAKNVKLVEIRIILLGSSSDP